MKNSTLWLTAFLLLFTTLSCDVTITETESDKPFDISMDIIDEEEDITPEETTPVEDDVTVQEVFDWDPEAIIAAATTPKEDVIREFLLSTPNTYGWETDVDDWNIPMNVGYDFFPDGRLHAQGPDGEATMWGGTWELTGDQLTIILDYYDPEGGDQINYTVPVRVSGEYLILEEAVYWRYSI